MTAITNTADRAAEHVGEVASQARKTLLGLSAQVGKVIQGAREAEIRGLDSMLYRLGLQRRQSGLRPVLWFVAGAVAAGGMVAVLMSPTTGKELRRRIATLFGTRTEMSATQVKKVEPPAELGSRPAVSTDGAKQEAG